MRTSLFLLTASMVAFHTPSIAAGTAPIVATFQVDLGKGFINSGKGFRSVAEPTGLVAGDSVMVGPGGSAEIVYSDACRTPVKPGEVAVVAPVPPCARGQGGGSTVYYKSGDSTVNYKSGDNAGYYLLGGAAAVGVGVGIWAATKSSSSPAPASP